MRKIQSIIDAAIKMQRVSYNNGHENQGASIDVIAEVRRNLQHRTYAKNKVAQELLTDINLFDTVEINEALKYAKSLSFKVKSFVRNEVQKLVK